MCLSSYINKGLFYQNKIKGKMGLFSSKKIGECAATIIFHGFQAECVGGK